jgi:hypothetical protein
MYTAEVFKNNSSLIQKRPVVEVKLLTQTQPLTHFMKLDLCSIALKDDLFLFY